MQPTHNEFNSAIKSCGFEPPGRNKYDAFTGGIRHSGITTKRELAMFLAQIIHESGGLKYKKEQNPAPGNYDKNPHNGAWYYGRGYIQLTWSYNYKAASIALYGNENVLLDDPDKVSREEDAAWATAFWFWKANVHNKHGVKDGHFGATTNAINGELECSYPNHPKALKRFDYYEKVLKAFHINERANPKGCGD